MRASQISSPCSLATGGALRHAALDALLQAKSCRPCGARPPGKTGAGRTLRLGVARCISPANWSLRHLASRVPTPLPKWLVVEAAARRKTIDIADLGCVRGPSGLRFAMSTRIGSSLGLLGAERLEPGIPRPVLLIFELPEDQIEGVHCWSPRPR